MIRFIHIVCLLFFSLPVFARRYTGVVIDKAGKQIIAYANIGIPGHNTGTVTDEKGLFVWDVPDSVSPAAMVIISITGYQRYRTSLQALAGLKMIPLEHAAPVLKHKPLKLKTVNRRLAGNTTHAMSVRVGFAKDSTKAALQLGYEVGTLIKNNRKSTHIDSVFINFAVCTYDSLFFRLNIYEAVKDSFIQVMPVPYYVRFSKTEALRGIRINLRDLELVVHNDFLISLELIREEQQQGQLFFTSGFLDSKAFFRAASQAEWLKLPMHIGIGMSAEVRD
jgi:hypothetical protein